jgi:CRISPR/Cas system-associated endoribonuclease Cas2
MALYSLSYDLRKKKDYKALYEELEKFNSVRILESLYSFKRNNTNAKALRNHFNKIIDIDDGLIVMEITDWATINTETSPQD